jgi:hypothetical protein
MSLSFPQPSPLACVHPLDPEYLDAGAAAVGESMLQPMDGDPLSNHWRYHLAHAEALQLSPTARAALLVATDRLQALLTAEVALQHAGEVLVRELQREDG